MVPGKMVMRAVPYREVQIVIGSFPSSHSYDFLHLVHSERGKVTIFRFIFLKGFLCFFSVKFSILKEVKEYHWAVFSVGQCREDRACGTVEVVHSKILKFIQTCCNYYFTLSNHYIRWTSRNNWLTVIPVSPGLDRAVNFFHI